MIEPDDLDVLLSNALASYIPEPSAALQPRIVQHLRKGGSHHWAFIPAALAAGIAAALLLRQPAVKPKATNPKMQTYTQPIQLSKLPPQNPLLSTVHSVKHVRRRGPLALTKEETLFLAVADKMPNQFPQLMAIPETKPIEPITIADLQPPPMTGDAQ